MDSFLIISLWLILRMQCFICVTYMIILCSAKPAKEREISIQHEKRSLFRDVIESLRIHSQLPDDINQNYENNLSQGYERYGFENEAQIPSDAEFIPRRNDRIAMPSLKYRFPKSLETNDTKYEVIDIPKEEVVVYIDTNKVKTTTQKPKKQKRPQPTVNKHKRPIMNKDNEDETETQTDDNVVMMNTMAGQSQIGNRESQTLVKPTVIVNIRGTVSHSESDTRLERRNDNETRSDVPQNIFNINQEIKLERSEAALGSKGSQKKEKNNVEQDVKIAGDFINKIEEDMMMCETATWKPEKSSQDTRKFDNVLQILFSI